MQRFFKFEWEAIAGLVAAVIALVMHFLHVVEVGVLLVIAVVLFSLFFIRDLRREPLMEQMRDSLRKTENGVIDIQSARAPPDTILIGPQQLRAESERFALAGPGRNALVPRLSVNVQTSDAFRRPAASGDRKSEGEVYSICPGPQPERPLDH